MATATVSEALQVALEHHSANRLAQAETLYREILRTQPNQPDALCGLGVLAQQVGKPYYAEQFLKASLKARPKSVKAWLSLGILYHAQGQWKDAVDAYKRALAIGPASALTYHNLGYTLQQQGQSEDAIACYRRALELEPDYTEAEVNMASVFYAQDRLSSEEQRYYASLNNDLGSRYEKAGDLTAAAGYYHQAIVMQPDIATAHYNLGRVRQRRQDYVGAISCFREAIRLQPKAASIHYALGLALQERDELKEAVGCYQRTLELEPGNEEAYYRLGQLYQTDNSLMEMSVSAYQEGLSTINPYYTMAKVLTEQGKTEDALQSYQRALSVQPDSEHAKFGICIGQLPVICASPEEGLWRRNNYRQFLNELAQHYQVASKEKCEKAANAVGSSLPFFLAYQGRNNLMLQKTYGDMICQLMARRYPQWSQQPERRDLSVNRKLRIGFVSAFFFDHSNWKIPIRGWVENLNKTKFQLLGYHTGCTEDEETINASSAFDEFVQGPLALEKWCEIITNDKLDVLIFPEIGMDPMTLKLACLRLAPVQMTSWGHPETSGLRTIDYYLSSDLMEPENAQEYYTERLVRLPNLSIYYSPIDVLPTTVKKGQLGVEDDETLYWCCQSLYKYLPEHDDVFPRIAKELGRCKFLFVEYGRYRKGKQVTENVTQTFRQRLSHAFQKYGLDYQDYSIVLPRMGISTFAGTAGIADVFLDSIGWSGCNSSLECIAQNLPIVTLPGDFMRGRHTMAILKMIGLEQTIVANKEDYVKIAVRLGKDPDYRQHIAQQIAANKDKLYDDLEPIRALEDVLSDCVRNPNLWGNALS